MTRLACLWVFLLAVGCHGLREPVVAPGSYLSQVTSNHVGQTITVVGVLQMELTNEDRPPFYSVGNEVGKAWRLLGGPRVAFASGTTIREGKTVLVTGRLEYVTHRSYLDEVRYVPVEVLTIQVVSCRPLRKAATLAPTQFECSLDRPPNKPSETTRQ